MDPGSSPLTAFVLAGGASRRMGRDKAMLAWGDTTLLEHMTGLLGQVTSNVRVAGRDALPDRTPGRGPVEGVRTSLAATETDINLIVAVDLPFLTAALLRQLRESIETGTAPLVAFDTGGRYPLSIAARKRLLPEVERYQAGGGRSLAGLIECTDCRVIGPKELARIGIDGTIFRNLNTPEEYADAHRDAFG